MTAPSKAKLTIAAWRLARGAYLASTTGMIASTAGLVAVLILFPMLLPAQGLGDIAGAASDIAGAVETAADGTNLTAAGGSVTVASFPFATYTDHPDVTNRYPRGVYTIAGTSAQEITVTMGGTDVTVGPGAFNCNAVPGPSDSVVITGAGVAEVGISRTPCHRFYSAIDGVRDADKLTRDSIVTNEIAMCTWRFRCEEGLQIYKSNLGRIGAFNDLALTQTNGACGGYDWQGYYEVGLMGMGTPDYPMTYDLYDARVFTRWLTDAELDRVHLNGVQEIGRRGIPQWR